MSAKEVKTAPHYYADFDKIKKGDIIFDECNGPCSGGARYGIGEVVTEVTDKAIVTASKSKFSRKSGKALAPPWAYFIEFWQTKRKIKPTGLTLIFRGDKVEDLTPKKKKNGKNKN